MNRRRLALVTRRFWPLVGGADGSVFAQTFWNFDAPDSALLDKWERIKAVRAEVNKALEAVRAEGRIGASLQAHVRLTVDGDET